MKNSCKKFLFVFAVLALFTVGAAFAQSSQAAENAEQVVASDNGMGGAIKYIAAAIAVGIACLGSGMAVGKIGAAAMGAMAENAELSGKALPFVGLAEGICLWGFLVALFIILM